MKLMYRSLFAWMLFTFLACSSTEADGQIVYITKTGKKYHRDNCQYLRYSKFARKLSVAKKFYTACLVCKPPIDATEEEETQEETEAASSSSGASAPTKKVPSVSQESKTTSSSQCSALTKAGTRCKRMTSEANGKCWQHQ